MSYDPAVRDNFLEHFFFVKNLNRKKEIEAEKVGLSYHIISLDFNDINFEKLLFFSQKSIIIEKNVFRKNP